MAEINTAADLTDENISAMDNRQLINNVILSFDIEDEFERIASTEKVHLERELEESPVVLFD